MKYLVIILALSFSALAQDTCFTKAQLDAIATGALALKWKYTYCDSASVKDSITIALQDSLLKKRLDDIKLLEQQRVDEAKAHAIIVKKLEAQRSTFWDKLLYALAGFGAGYIIIHK